MFALLSQGLTVCQVKLSNGLVLHGPQCQSEAEANEKAALFTLQRLVTIFLVNTQAQLKRFFYTSMMHSG